VGLTTEMPGGGATGSGQVPLHDRELLISALDHKPMDRIRADGPANLALEFLQTRHAFSLERWLGKGQYSGKKIKMSAVPFSPIAPESRATYTQLSPTMIPNAHL
jgi:hypothetical protein